jgi:hypothetical protein
MPVAPPGFHLDITGTGVIKVTELKYMHDIGMCTILENIFETLARKSAVSNGTRKYITVFTKPWERSHRVPDILNLHPLSSFV